MNPYPISDHPLIVFLSDFGLHDPYVGIVKGVIHSICPEAKVIDLTHEIPPHDIEAAAYILSRTWRDFPDGTIFLSVVDPGVGGPRAALAARAQDALFIAPDNGLISFLREEFLEIRQITDERFIRSGKMSATFHGRDIFAPAAAHLAKGTDLKELGPETEGITMLERAPVNCSRDGIHGSIVWFDRFGNGATDIPASLASTCFGEDFPSRVRAVVRGMMLPIVRTFSDVPKGSPLAIVNSFGDIEICINGDSAKKRLELAKDEPVRLILSAS